MIISILYEDYVRIHKMNLKWIYTGKLCYVSPVTSRVSPIHCNHSGDQARAIPHNPCGIALCGIGQGYTRRSRGEPSMMPQQWGLQWGLAGSLRQSLINKLNIWEKCSITNFWMEYCWLGVKQIWIPLWICTYFNESLNLSKRTFSLTKKGCDGIAKSCEKRQHNIKTAVGKISTYWLLTQIPLWKTHITNLQKTRSRTVCFSMWSFNMSNCIKCIWLKIQLPFLCKFR